MEDRRIWRNRGQGTERIGGDAKRGKTGHIVKERLHEGETTRGYRGKEREPEQGEG